MKAIPIGRDLISCPEICEKCQARTVSICSVLPNAELRRLDDCLAIKAYGRGDIIIAEGEPAQHVFNLTLGMAMLTRSMADGRRQVLGFLFKGDFVGLLQRAEYKFSVEALGDVQTCRFPRGAFQRLLLDTPNLEHELLSRASDELAAAQTHVMLLGRKTATERVASFLLHLSQRQVDLGGAEDTVLLPMTRLDIADYLGLTMETVSRVMSTFKRQGLLRILDDGAVRFAHRRVLQDAAATDASMRQDDYRPSCLSG